MVPTYYYYSRRSKLSTGKNSYKALEEIEFLYALTKIRGTSIFPSKIVSSPLLEIIDGF